MSSLIFSQENSKQIAAAFVHSNNKSKETIMGVFSATALFLVALVGCAPPSGRGWPLQNFLRTRIGSSDVELPIDDNDDAILIHKSPVVSYLDQISTETSGEQAMRLLSFPEPEGAYFRPLDCNVPSCQVKTTWTKKSFDLESGTVVIPCGMCVWMDVDEETIILPHGIDIQGHLYLPDGISVTIETPFILNQGLLEINSTSLVSKSPNVKVLIRGNTQSISFIPAGNNELVCSDQNGHPGLCDIGFRGIVTAGGRVNIRGLPEDCTTWTHLHDVVKVPEDSEPYHFWFTKLPDIDEDHVNPYCRVHDPYVEEEFSNQVSFWTGGYGAPYKVEHDMLRVYDRKSETEHAPTLDMIAFQDCLVPNQDYLFTAKVRIWDPLEARGALTPCALDGDTNCLELHYEARSSTGRHLGRRKKRESMNDGYSNYEWQHFYATLTFSEEEVDPLNLFQILQLRGPQTRYNIDVDEVNFALPHYSLVPDPKDVCGRNLIMNGDAEGSEIHPYPMKASGGHLSIFTFETGNRVFRLTKRMRDEDSLEYNLDAPNCVKTGSRYKIAARVYALSEDIGVKMEIKYRIFFKDGVSKAYTAAECPPSQIHWVECESEFSIVDEIDPLAIENVKFWFVTIDAPTVDYAVDDFLLELVRPPRSGILVPAKGIQNCWGKGSELLITSHTLDSRDSQRRRLVNAPVPVGDGMVRLDLDDYILYPVTKKHDGGLYAVEVALLNRNIRFEAATWRDDPLLGGHFMVLRTPNVNQHIEGIDFVNFGQQGELGRYPIHIHLCKNAYSVIARNTVRHSNQRCVVIHGSHNTTIFENVAYDTFGHCFITEDGGELHNKFIRNIGSGTKTSSRIVRPGETDNTNPSTFWSANPTNDWIGNVAAGCEANGWWLELLDHVRGPTALMETSFGMNPRRMPLGKFVDNVAHSNRRHGLKMYPHGLLPSKTAVFENFMSYKNRLDGLFFRNVVNATVKGGVLADNRNQADFDGRSGMMLIEGTRLVGRTNRYREIAELQGSLFVNEHQDRVVGLELHSFTRDPSMVGLEVKNITFQDFDNTGSDFTSLVEIDSESDDRWSGQFDFWTTFEDVQIVPSLPVPNHFNFINALDTQHKGVYLIDLDSSMKPSMIADGSRTASSIISDSDEMKEFVDLTKCFPFEHQGYLYCHDTCLRSVSFAVDPGQSKNLRLRIRTIPAGQSYYFEGSQDFLIHDDIATHSDAKTDLQRLRYFNVALPPGQYKALFVDVKTDEKLWPTFVETIPHPQLCDSGFEDKDFVMAAYEVDFPQECQQLVRNSQFESSTLSPWLQTDTSLELASGHGIDGSTALREAKSDSTKAAIAQYIDARCLVHGSMYLIQAWVRLSEDDSFVACGQEEGKACPSMKLVLRKQGDEMGVSSNEDTIIVGTQFAQPQSYRGWNRLHGVITVDKHLSEATSAAIYVERERRGLNLYLDDVSMTLIENDCKELVFNGDCADGTSLFWESNHGNLQLRKTRDNPALLLTNRITPGSSIFQKMATGCMKTHMRYAVVAKVRVFDDSMATVDCNEESRSIGEASCPRIRIRAFSNFSYSTRKSVMLHEGHLAETDYGTTSDGWRTISGIFSATHEDEVADQLTLEVNGPEEEFSFAVKDISVSPLPSDCSELIVNGDAEVGDTPMFWRLFIKSETSEIKIIKTESDNQALLVRGREHFFDGIGQIIDANCMTIGSKWKVEAEMRFFLAGTRIPVACDPLEQNSATSCPAIRVLTVKNGARVEDGRSYMSNADSVWLADEFNLFESHFEITSAIASGEEYLFGIRNFNQYWDLVIDNISVTPI